VNRGKGFIAPCELAGSYLPIYYMPPESERREVRMWLLREIQLVCAWLALRLGRVAMWAELAYRREVMA